MESDDRLYAQNDATRLSVRPGGSDDRLYAQNDATRLSVRPGGEEVIPIPTLAEVVADGAKLADLPFTALWALLRDVGQLEKEIIAAMLPAANKTMASTAIPEDRALTIEEAAQRLRIAPATMQKWLRKPPYDAAVVVRSRTCVRVSAQRLDDILLNGGARHRRKAVSG